MSYFGRIRSGIVTTARGLLVTWKHLFRKTATVQYPEETPYSSPYERGLHEFEPDVCIICELCAKACPVDCIYIEQEGRGKTAKLTRFAIDYNKCLFCHLCVDPCPVDCIHMGQQHDIASFERESGMIVEFTRGEGPWRTAKDCADPRTGVRAHERD